MLCPEKLLLRCWRRRRKKEGKLQGGVEEAQRIVMAAVRRGVRREERHGDKQRFQDVGRTYGDLRAAEAGAERLLRQTLGAGRWATHRTNRISP